MQPRPRRELWGCPPRCQSWPRAHSATRGAAGRLCLPPGNGRAPVWVNTPLREARCKAAQGGWEDGRARNGVPAGKICRDLARGVFAASRSTKHSESCRFVQRTGRAGLQGPDPSPLPVPTPQTGLTLAPLAPGSLCGGGRERGVQGGGGGEVRAAAGRVSA